MSWWDKISGNVQTEEEAAANYARLQQELRDQADRRLAEGTISEERYARDMVAAGGRLEDVGAAYREGFVEGLGDGRDNVRSSIGAFISNFLKLIPWQLWIVLVIAAFVYLGGIQFLQRRLARA